MTPKALSTTIALFLIILLVIAVAPTNSYAYTPKPLSSRTIQPVTSVAPTGSYAYAPKFFPNRGDLNYDGHLYADSYFSWDAVGGWRSTSPGFEMDISLEETYFDYCTSWTNLPDPYDDCPTAGTLDPAGRRNFGIGTFSALQIQPSTWYQAKWWFGGGSAETIWTYPNVAAQEVSRTLCPYKDIWCYDGVQGTSLMETYWRYTEPSYKDWYHDTYYS